MCCCTAGYILVIVETGDQDLKWEKEICTNAALGCTSFVITDEEAASFAPSGATATSFTSFEKGVQYRFQIFATWDSKAGGRSSIPADFQSRDGAFLFYPLALPEPPAPLEYCPLIGPLAGSGRCEDPAAFSVEVNEVLRPADIGFGT